jgi:CRISPR/Cas system-associated exonuclease Cas4 (RecB family)
MEQEIMLKELIDKFYLEREKDRTQSKFYITDAGKCQRATFFKFKKAPRKKMEPRILRIFDHGDYIHQLIMKSLFGVRKIHVVASEVNMPPMEIISGRADAILSIDNNLYVLDIKSMNSMVFRNLTFPKEENLYQIQLYLHYFKIKKGILLYVDKDQQELKEFIVDYDKELCEKLIVGFQKLKSKIEVNVVPCALSDYPDNWQCSYCPFREICDIAGPKEIKWDQFKKKIGKEF